MRLIPVIALTIAALAAVEGAAWWWMHPKPAGEGEAVLVYQPSPVPVPLLDDDGGDLRPGHPAPSRTELPEVVAKTIETLHCSTGNVARLEQENGVVCHVAFFQWDSSGSTNVLEAFKHLPEQCMGSIGMELVSRMPARTYAVGTERLVFDHTLFRSPGGVLVHAFKGTWVSGASTLIGDHFRGGGDQWRELRWRAGLKRFRPAYARVAQGAVQGINEPDLAWTVFENAMLKDLRMQQDPG